LDRGGKRHSVKEIFVHESYTDPVLGFDVALLKLSEPSEEVTIDFVNESTEKDLVYPGVLA
jgi:secreted trypsin-like serine protease